MRTKQALVTVGGIGSRLRKHGVDVPLSKSFMLLLGKPLLYWCLEGLYAAGIEKLCIVGETPEKLTRAEEVMRELPYRASNIRFYQDPGLGSTGLPYQTRASLDDRFFFECGHSIAEPTHYQTMDDLKQEGNIVASAFKPNRHSVRPWLTINQEGSVETLQFPSFKETEYFIGSPLLIDQEYSQILPTQDFNFRAILSKYSSQNKLKAVISELPIEIDEFEEMEEGLHLLRQYLTQRIH